MEEGTSIVGVYGSGAYETKMCRVVNTKESG